MASPISPNSNIYITAVHLLQLMEQYWYIIIYQNLHFTRIFLVLI